MCRHRRQNSGAYLHRRKCRRRQPVWPPTRLDLHGQESVQSGLRTNIGTVVATSIASNQTVTDADAPTHRNRQRHSPDASIRAMSTAMRTTMASFKQAGELAIAGATVTLTGTNDLGQTVTVFCEDDGNGLIQFTGWCRHLQRQRRQPSGWADGKRHRRQLGGSASVNDKISALCWCWRQQHPQQLWRAGSNRWRPVAQNSAVVGIEDTTYKFTLADFKSTDANAGDHGQQRHIKTFAGGRAAFSTTTAQAG